MYALAGKIDINFLKDEISVVKGKRIFSKIFGLVLMKSKEQWKIV